MIKWTVYCHESKWIKWTVPRYYIYTFYKLRFWCYLYHSIMNSGKHKGGFTGSSRSGYNVQHILWHNLEYRKLLFLFEIVSKIQASRNYHISVQAFFNPNVHIDKISKLHFLSKMRPFIVFIYTCRIKEICASFNL